MKILVGPRKSTFYLAPSILKKAGAYFASALKKEWMEGQERTIELEDEDPRHFQIYAEWLYTGTIFCKNERAAKGITLSLLVNLYIFGDKRLDFAFQNRVIDAIIATIESEQQGFGARDINNVWDRTPERSPIRSLMIDWCVFHGYGTAKEKWTKTMENVKREFLHDLLPALFEQRAVTVRAKLELVKCKHIPGCAYHHHGNNERCNGVKRAVGSETFEEALARFAAQRPPT